MKTWENASIEEMNFVNTMNGAINDLPSDELYVEGHSERIYGGNSRS